MTLTREDIEELKRGWMRSELGCASDIVLLCDLAAKGCDAEKLAADRAALLAALKNLVGAQIYDFHPQKINGVEWFTARAVIAAAEAQDTKEPTP